jgi:DNA-binding transcriptional LysR family regulator
MLDQQGLANVPVLMELDGADSVKRAVQQGLGLGVALRSGVEWELEHGLLRELQLGGPRPEIEIGLVTDPRRHGSPITQEFFDYLRDQLREQLTPRRELCEEEQCEQRPGAAAGRAAGRLAHRR